MLDEPQGLYDRRRLTAADLDSTGVVPLRVAGTNHYTILIADPGAAVVARRITAAAY